MLTFLLPFYASSQVGGNQINNYDKYNPGYRSTAPVKIALTDTTIVIEVKILENTAADFYLVTMGISQKGKTVAETLDNLKKIGEKFTSQLKQNGIPSEKIQFDFVNQYKIFELTEINNTTYKEELTGFEANSTATIRIEKIEELDKILVIASQLGIYDLIKVDYMLNDIYSHKQKLMNEAANLLLSKKTFYEKTANMRVHPNGSIYAENFEAIQPSEQYERFQSATSSEISSYGESRYRIIKSPEPLSFFYNPKTADSFDKVLNPQIFGPSVQLVYTLQVKYRLLK